METSFSIQARTTSRWRRIVRLPLADSLAEMTFPAHQAQHPASLPPSLLVSAIVARPPHKSHCWLTNKINNPAAINRASRIPTTNEVTGCRLGLTSFDAAPFCAAPRPNQKRSLSIAVSSHHRRCFVAVYLRSCARDIAGGPIGHGHREVATRLPTRLA